MENEKKTELSLEELECVSGGANGAIPIVGDYVRVKYPSNVTRPGKVVSIGTRSYNSGFAMTVYYVEFYDSRQPKVDAVPLSQIL